MKERVVIVGGGLGGLFSGAFLAKNGYNVTVLEKNAIIGGGLQCFTRNGKTFETGMHVLGGFHPGGTMYKICNYLGILPLLDLEHIDSKCIDEIYFNSTKETFHIRGGKEGFIRSLSKYFPHETEGIRSYTNKLWALTKELPLFYIEEDEAVTRPFSEQQLWPTNKFIDFYINDIKLKKILAYLNPLYGGVYGHTPTFVHALICQLFIDGSSRFRGGSQQMANALKNLIISFGGKVLNGKKVVRIKTSEAKATEVLTDRGLSFECDYIISAIHPDALLSLIPEHSFKSSYIKRIKSIPNSYSAFSIYIDLKEKLIPYIPFPSYYHDDYEAIWNQGDVNCGPTSKAFVYMTPADFNQGDWASRMLVYSPLSFEEVRKWEDSKIGHRGDEYEKWKESYAYGIIDKIETRVPGLKNAIKKVYTSSPLTIRDFYGVKDGAVFGVRKDSENIMLSHIPIRTKIKNLFLTGQNINLHGICGVPLTAIQTCEALLGSNFLIRKINEANNI